MRIVVTMLAGFALAAQPAIGFAQKAKPKTAAPSAKAAPAKAAPSEAQLKEAADTLSLLVSAFNSKDIPAETKNGLMLCLYGNPLGKIARGQAEALAANTKIDANSPTQRLLVVASLCNAPLPKPAAEPAEAKPAEAKPAEPAEGR